VCNKSLTANYQCKTSKWQVTNYLSTIKNESIGLIILITSWFTSKLFFPPFRLNGYHYPSINGEPWNQSHQFWYIRNPSSHSRWNVDQYESEHTSPTSAFSFHRCKGCHPAWYQRHWSCFPHCLGQGNGQIELCIRLFLSYYAAHA
jgi:hypothetical protein